LELDDCTKSHTGWKLFVEFTLRIKDQVQSHHHEKTSELTSYSFFLLSLPRSQSLLEQLVIEAEIIIP
jgi:hypothetical protein